MSLLDGLIPNCPKCSADEMGHRFVKVGSPENGWYCGKCGAGSYRLGTTEDARANVNTEAEAAKFALALINKSSRTL